MDKNTNPHDLPTATATATPFADKPGERLRHVLGLDVDLHFAVTAASTARLLKNLQHHAKVRIWASFWPDNLQALSFRACRKR